MSKLKAVLSVAGAIATMLAIMFVLQGIGLVNFMFWAPKWQEAKREVFEETQSFVHGKISHLNRLRLEYESTSSETRKRALRTMILQEAAVLEKDNLPADLRAFIQRLEGGI